MFSFFYEMRVIVIDAEMGVSPATAVLVVMVSAPKVEPANWKDNVLDAEMDAKKKFVHTWFTVFTIYVFEMALPVISVLFTMAFTDTDGVSPVAEMVME